MKERFWRRRSSSAWAGTAQAAPQLRQHGCGLRRLEKGLCGEAKAMAWAAAGSPALAKTSYSNATIKADRSQHSFKLSLEQFMQKRGAAAIISRGKKLKAQNAALFAKIEKRYGVAAGPLIAIWGMETAFGAYMGKQTRSRRWQRWPMTAGVPTSSREQLNLGLKLVDKVCCRLPRSAPCMAKWADAVPAEERHPLWWRTATAAASI